MSAFGQKRSLDYMVSTKTRKKAPGRQHRPDPCRAERLVRNRLVDELLHQLAEVGPLRARRLRHQHRDYLLLRVHPEVGAGVTRPHELARRARHARDAIALAHHETEAEG